METKHQMMNGQVYTRMGTLEGGFTREALRQMGIHMEPVPFSQCLSFKYDGAGNINRYKTRLALSGHKGRLRKGIEYNGSTHASTPTIATTTDHASNHGEVSDGAVII